MTDIFIDPDNLNGGRDGSPSSPYNWSDLVSGLGFAGGNTYYIKQGTTSYVGGAYSTGWINLSAVGTAGIVFDIWEFGGSTLPTINAMRDLTTETWTQDGTVGGVAVWYMAPRPVGNKAHERTYINGEAQGQATSKAAMTDTEPVFYDISNNRLYIRNATSPAAMAAHAVEVPYVNTKLFAGAGADGVYINNLNYEGTSICNFDLTSNVTTFEFDNVNHLRNALNYPSIAINGTFDFSINGFVYQNGLLDASKVPNEDIAISLTEDHYPWASCGVSHGIQLYNNVGPEYGGTPGDGAIIRNATIKDYGHAGITIAARAITASDIKKLRCILIEDTTFNGVNSNHSRPFSIAGYRAETCIARNIIMDGCNTQCQMGTANSEYYNLLFTNWGDDPLNRDGDPLTVFFGNCWVWWRPECKSSEYPDCDRPPVLEQVVQGNYFHSATFKNTMNCPMGQHSGAFGWGDDPIAYSGYAPNVHENIIFDNCNYAATDAAPANLVIHYNDNGNEYNYLRQSAQTWNKIIAYTAGVDAGTTNLIGITDSVAPYNEILLTLNGINANNGPGGKFENFQNFSIGDPELDGTYTPAITGSAFDTGANVGTSYDVYGNVRPGAASEFYDIGAVEQQGYTTVFVSPLGSDTTGTGTQLNPFLTLDKAASVATGKLTPGGVIMMRGGSYTVGSGVRTITKSTTGSFPNPPSGLVNNPHVNGTSQSPITVKAYNFEPAVLDMTHRIDVDNWIFKDLIFSYNGSGLILGVRDEVLRTVTVPENLSILNNSFKDMHNAGIYGLNIFGVDGLKVYGNEFDNIRSAASGSDGFGIGFKVFLNNVHIANNRFSDISGDGIQWTDLHTAKFGDAYAQKSFTNIIVEYNDFLVTKPYVPRDSNGVPYDEPWPVWASYCGENGIDVKYADGNCTVRYNRVYRFRPTTANQDATGASGEGIVVHLQTADVEVYGNEIIDCQRGIDQGAPDNVMSVKIHSNYIRSLPAGERADDQVPITNATVNGIQTGGAGYTVYADVYNNTVDLSHIPAADVISHINADTNVKLHNNIFLGGANSTSTCSVPITTSNNFWGTNVTPASNHNGSGDQSGDPELDSRGMPLPASTVEGAGVTLATMGPDKDGFAFSDPPNMGCFAQRTPVPGDYIERYSLRREIVKSG